MMPVSQSVAAPRLSPRLFTALLFLLALFSVSSAQAQLTGTRNIPGDYADLALAIADLNTQGVGAGGVTLNLVAGNPQTAPAGGYAITTLTGAAGSTITIQGNGNTVTAPNPQASGLLNDAFFKIVGADFVTITGFTMQENAANTTTAAGSNNMTEFGVALYYASVTDGAKNVSILNNTITLNRVYQNTFGIYATVRHSISSLTVADITAASGAHDSLRIHGNTISNVNMGVVVIGSLVGANMATGLDIGGSSAATANTISNYGTTGTFSAYPSVSGSVNGILVNNQQNFNISRNAITSSNGGVTGAFSLRGIYVQTTGTLPTTGTFTRTIDNNVISVRSAAVGSAMLGIANEGGNLTTTLSISGNDVNNSSHTVASSGAVTFISNTGTTFNTTINTNTFTNLSINTTGNATFITNSVTHPAGAVTTVNNNAIVGTFAKTGAGGTVRLYDAFGSTTTGSETNTGNNFSNITLTGATTFGGWRSADGAAPLPAKTVTNNTFNNLVLGSGVSTVLEVSYSPVGSNVVSGNVISNVSAGGTLAGIFSQAGSHDFSSNTIGGLSTTGASLIGLSVTGGVTQTVSRNKIHDLQSSNAAGTVFGISATSAAAALTTANIVNNLVGDLRAPLSTAASDSVRGISLISTTTNSAINLSYNTIYLNASSAGANFSTAGVFHTTSATATTAPLTLRNNVIVNTSTPAGTGNTVAYRRSSTALNNYGAASNNNGFYAGAAGVANLIFSDGTNSDQTIVAYRDRVASRDSASVSENPSFLSTSGASAQFLHINPAVATQLEGGGVAISGITTDFDGDSRNVSTPDIGADEFAGIFLDAIGPAISYSSFVSTASTSNRTLTVSISDLSGVDTAANSPRIYFRKNAGVYVSSQCTGASPSYSCTIDYSLVGGVVAPDVIDYFVIAQDTLGNVSANPSGGVVAANVNTVTTPPTTPNSYSIVPTIPATITVGTGETITSLTNPGGLFAAINGGALVGNVTVTITSDLLAETGTVALNPISEDGAGGYTLTIRPSSAAERLIEGTAATGLIRLNGADRVIIDGRFGGTGRFLRLRNTNTGGPTVAFSNDATLNTVRSATIEGTNTSATSGTILFGTAGGVLGNSGNSILDADLRDLSTALGVPANAVFSSGSAGGPNANNTISGNNIYNWTNAGVLVSATGTGTGWEIAQNNLYQTAARTTALTGIAVLGGSGQNVLGNSIGGSAPLAAGAFLDTNSTFRGIDLLVGTTPATSVQGNAIKNIRSTFPAASFTASYGIFLQAGTANIGTVVGNQVGSSDVNERYEINGDSYGIRVVSTTTVDLRNNTVNNFGTNATPPGGEFYFGMSVEGAGGAHTVVSNTVSNITNNSTPAGSDNTQTIGITVSASGIQTVRGNTVSGIGSTNAAASTVLNNRVWGMIVSAAAVGTVVERNSISNIYASSPSAGARVDIITALQIQSLANAAVSNNMISVSGGAASDRAIFGILDLNAAGAAASYSYNSVRVFGSGGAANNSFAFNRNGVGAVTLRNNIFSNTRTGGTGFHVAMANSNASATGWNATASNYNLVHNATPAHVTQWLGSLAANNQTLAGFQTASSGDANSITADPLFVSDTDLHLQTGSPATDAGTPVAGITVDFDGDTRNPTMPEIGADEFPNTVPVITPTAGGIARQQGSSSSNSQIAVVSDAESLAASLVVTTTSVPTGLTVSNIVNTGGAITADVVASCSATAGANSVGLRVTDAGTLFADAILTVNVSANAAPTLGVYPAAGALVAGAATVTPNAAPADNGSLASVTVAAPGFTGTLSVDAVTGVVTVSNAGPAGTYTVTVTATDNCGQASTATFVLTVNAANTEPTISASAGVSAKAGDPSASVLIATVADAEDAENTLAVTVNGGASASSNGITISGLAVTPSGAVNANVVASCSATNASFTLRVTDSGLLFDEDSLAVNVLANTTPTLSYGTTALQLGAGTTVNPATGPTDSGSIASVVVLSAGTFTGTASASLNGNVTLGNAGPVGSHTLTIRVTDNCTATRDAALLVNVLGDPIFGNGFEDLNMIPAQMQLPLGKAGELQRLSLPQFDLLHVTPDKALVNLVEFDIGGVVVLLQLRDQQLRLLSQDAEHGIVAGQWFDLIGSGTPQLQWVNRSVGDTLRVEAALTQD